MTFSITAVTRGLLSTGSFTGALRGVGIVVSVPLAGIADLLSFMSAASTVASKEKDENRLSPLGEASFNQQIDAVRIEMPDKGNEIKFKNHKPSITAPFMIYADFEAFIIPISSCEPRTLYALC